MVNSQDGDELAQTVNSLSTSGLGISMGAGAPEMDGFLVQPHQNSHNIDTPRARQINHGVFAGSEPIKPVDMELLATETSDIQLDVSIDCCLCATNF